jgi:radixin
MMEHLKESKNMEAAERAKLEEEIRTKQEEVERIQNEVDQKDEETRRLQVFVCIIMSKSLCKTKIGERR